MPDAETPPTLSVGPTEREEAPRGGTPALVLCVLIGVCLEGLTGQFPLTGLVWKRSVEGF